MSSHEIARKLLSLPDCPVVVSGSWLKVVGEAEIVRAKPEDSSDMYYDSVDENDNSEDIVSVVALY